MKRVVIVKDGEKIYGQPYEDIYNVMMHNFLNITLEDCMQFLKLMEEHEIDHRFYDTWYTEKV